MVTAEVRGQVVSSPCVCQGISLEGRIERGIFLDGTSEQKIYNVVRTIKSRAFTAVSIHTGCIVKNQYV